jgi:hypothetical protein
MSATTAEPDAWVSLAKGRQTLGISRPTLIHLIDAGAIGCRRIPGGRPRIRLADVQPVLAASTSPARSSAP